MSLVIDNAKFHEIIQEQIAKQKHDHTETKFNHKIYRTIIKKVKRKIRRQVVARKRDEQIQIEEDQRSKDPLYQAGLAQQEEIQKKKELEEEKEKKCQLWHERELLAKIQWEAKQKREQAAKIQQQQQAKTVHALSTKTSNLKIKSTRTSASKIQIEKEKPTAVIGQQLEDQPTHNPFASGIAGIERPKCSFFLKTGVCKYNERCSRFHDRPDVSNTILLLNMYSNFEMQYGLDDEYDADIGLEFEESERYQNFKEFYYDVLPEFEAFGHVVEFKVCSNFEIHLRGNVYVQFKTDDEAVRAFQRMNGRFYGGKMLQCEFVNITNWKNSICGM
ncbi:unnamed protein product [Didymodactylos carnosus]|uniref:Uncharacterized protein n=1 Tax=Didymodactylos carnosus TaxID=1234261 RepID=A0A813X244_9BILA|nr:unnamed protein product [Didymodactylos carnosus]CAF3651585.1 unnamed protein product [Didymodactylos carnosus]